MKQSLTSARRPLEVLIHIISWGIMFGFPKRETYGLEKGDIKKRARFSQ